jgi:hypothetical protein
MGILRVRLSFLPRVGAALVGKVSRFFGAYKKPALTEKAKSHIFPLT